MNRTPETEYSSLQNNIRGPLAHLAEHRSFKAGVEGSSPSRLTIFLRRRNGTLLFPIVFLIIEKCPTMNFKKIYISRLVGSVKILSYNFDTLGGPYTICKIV